MPPRPTSDYDAKAMAKTKFPPEFSIKVDMTKVEIPVVKIWVEKEIKRLIDSDDDIPAMMVTDVLEDTKSPPDAKKLQKLQQELSGFLGPENSATFCLTLWNHCIDASKDPRGVPTKLIEQKKQEIKSLKEKDEVREAERAAETEREARTDAIRDRERSTRDRGRGDRSYGRGFDRGGRPQARYSRDGSPLSRHYGDNGHGERNSTTDRYVPQGNGARPPRRDYPQRRSRSRSPLPRNDRDRRGSPPPRYRQRSPPRHNASRRHDHHDSHERYERYERRSDHGRNRRRNQSPSASRSPGPSSLRRNQTPSTSRSPGPRSGRRNTSSEEADGPPKQKRLSRDEDSRPASRDSIEDSRPASRGSKA